MDAGSRSTRGAGGPVWGLESATVEDTARRSSIHGVLIPVAVGAAIFAILAVFAGMDPVPGVTASNSPFTDEAWMVLNARNFVVLGHWSVDDWNRQYVSIPYSVAHAVAFFVAGVGIVQARLVEITAVAITTATIAAAIGRVARPGPAVLAALAFGTSTLVLYNGRLALLEPIAGLGLTVGAVLLAVGSDRRPAVAGAIAGVALAAAVSTKVVAAPALVGILVAGLGLAANDPALRRRWLAALAALAIWVAFVLLPHWATVTALVTTIPAEPLPPGVGPMLSAIREFLGADGVRLAAPLLVAALVGTLVTIALWREAAPRMRSLLVVAGAWSVTGIGLLAIVPYSPNRYLVPMLPPLALLVGVGAEALAGRFGRVEHRTRSWVIGVTVAVLLTLPGIVSYLGWIRGAPSAGPAAQARFAAAIPPGATVEGNYAPLFAMRTTGPTIFTAFGLNPGDLYAKRGVRWLVLDAGEVPAWAPLHREAWAARRLVTSTSWGHHTIGLYQLP